MGSVDGLALERLERDLARALAWQPSTATLDRLDDRVRGLQAAPVPSRSRRWRGPLALLAAAALLMGAARVLTLVQQAAQEIPGHVVAYERGVQLNLTRTAGDYRITLERAYGDPNQLVLAFSVTGPSGASPLVVRADVVDAAGRHFLDFAGGDATDLGTAGSGSILAFDVPPGVSGTETLTASITALMPIRNVVAPDPSGLTYTFDVPFGGQAPTVDPNQAVTVDGHAITLRWLRVTATAVRLRLDTDLASLGPGQFRVWVPEATLQHNGGEAEPLSWQAMPPSWTGQPKAEMLALIDGLDGSVVIYQAMSGTDDPSGTWTIRVNRLTGSDGRGDTTSVEGPWVFTVKVP